MWEGIIIQPLDFLLCRFSIVVERLAIAKKGYSKAVGAVARHSAEAAFQVLHRQQPYRDPAAVLGRKTGVDAR